MEQWRSHVGEDEDHGGSPWNMLEWAFCGTSQTIPAITEDGVEKPEHSIWHHWIDSKTATPEADEGDMWPQDNGDVLERGYMKHPRTGKQVEYEELWEDIDALAIKTEGSDVTVRKCTVLKRKSDEAKGLVIRIGQYIQGMMRSLDGLRLLQYEWQARSGKDAGVGVWTKTLSLGHGRLPCERIINGLEIKVGDFFDYGTGRWELVEDFSW